MPSMPPERPVAVLLTLSSTSALGTSVPPNTEALEAGEGRTQLVRYVQLNITLDDYTHQLITSVLNGALEYGLLPRLQRDVLITLVTMLAQATIR